MADALDASSPPETFDALKRSIGDRFPTLPRQLRVIAEYVVENPDDMALETVAALAERMQVQPSSLVRFAQALGYDGFSAMQRIFRTRLIEGTPTYRERIRQIRGTVGTSAPRLDTVASQAIQQGIASLEHLGDSLRLRDLDAAIGILARARDIYLVAHRRSFPVVFYMSYALARLERRCHLVDGVGGLFTQQIKLATPKDAVLAVSFRTYSPDVVECVRERRAAGVPVVAVTDSPLSPLVGLADASFEIQDDNSQPFRSLVAPMCLAQALIVGLGHRLDGKNNNRPSRRKTP